MASGRNLRRSGYAACLVALFAGAGFVGGVMGGCVSNYPAVPTTRGVRDNPNSPAAEQAMIAALRWVGTRYTPGRPDLSQPLPDAASRAEVQYPMAVNLPFGLRKLYYDRVALNTGPEVVPLTPEIASQGSLPIFHVGRVWVRGPGATVDVFRPMPELGLGPDGKTVYQMVTVRLDRDGLAGPWRVIHGRAWEPGWGDVPEFYFVPDVDRWDQWEVSTQAEAEAQLEPTPE